MIVQYKYGSVHTGMEVYIQVWEFVELYIAVWYNARKYVCKTDIICFAYI